MKKALIVVDYQNDFVSSDGVVAKKVPKILSETAFPRLQNLSGTIEKLMSVQKRNEDKIIFVKSDYNENFNLGRFREFRAKGPYGNAALIGTWGHELFKIKEKADHVILKHHFDSFYQTDLNKYLKDNSISDLYLCGVNTDFCVFHTAITAAIFGYNVYVISDATDTITNNKQIFLEYLEKYIGVAIITSKDFLFRLASGIAEK